MYSSIFQLSVMPTAVYVCVLLYKHIACDLFHPIQSNIIVYPGLWKILNCASNIGPGSAVASMRTLQTNHTCLKQGKQNNRK